MYEKTIDNIVWFIPFKKTRNAVRAYLKALLNLQDKNMNEKTIDYIVWWIPFKNLRNNLRSLLKSILYIKSNNGDNDILIKHYNEQLDKSKNYILELHKEISKFDIDIFDLYKRNGKKKILSVEANTGHDCITPSFYKYFTDLGYEVDFLFTIDNGTDRWNFFERIYEKNYKINKFLFPFVNAILSMKSTNEYDFIFFNTDFVFNQHRLGANYPYINLLNDICGFTPNPKYGMFQMFPHFAVFSNEQKKVLIDTHKINNITSFNLVGCHNIPMFSAHYFGDIKITHKSKENIFLASGNLTPHQKNHSLLIAAAELLTKNGIFNFKVLVNGKYGTLDIPAHLSGYIQTIGDNEPKELFKIIEECDFITALLDSKNDWQRNFYGSGTCSVAALYALGFQKPYLLEDFFAKPMLFNDETAIIYKGQNLYSAMKRAIEMTNEEYAKMQNALLKEAQRRYNKTLEDLKREMNKMITENKTR